MTTEPLAAVDLDRTALVVVDAQVAFASADSPIAETDRSIDAAVETVPRVRELLQVARAADLPVAFTRSLRRADGRDAPAQVYDVVPTVAEGREPICCAGAPDAEFVEGLEPRDDEYTVEKQRYNAFHGTPLEYYLHAEDVETVLICGFTTNVCVEGTARGAHERGFNVVAVEDCCAALDPDQHEAGLRNIELILGATVPLEDVRQHLNARPQAEHA